MTTRIPAASALMPNAKSRGDIVQKFRSVPIQIPETKFLEDEGIVLTGRVQKVPPPAIPSSGEVATLLDRDLELAEKIVDFVNNHIIFSQNYPNRMRPDAVSISEDDLEERLGYVREGKNDKERLARSVESGVGNCAEMTSMGLLYPNIGATRVERYEIADPGDHVFLVIGRDSNTDPNDSSTWNPETVICDPWANAYYPASQITDFLPYVCGVAVDVPEDGIAIYVPLISPFDPQFHSLNPYRVEGNDSLRELMERASGPFQKFLK